MRFSVASCVTVMLYCDRNYADNDDDHYDYDYDGNACVCLRVTWQTVSKRRLLMKGFENNYW